MPLVEHQGKADGDGTADAGQARHFPQGFDAGYQGLLLTAGFRF